MRQQPVPDAKPHRFEARVPGFEPGETILAPAAADFLRRKRRAGKGLRRRGGIVLAFR
jgi:hypothetical protein